MTANGSDFFPVFADWARKKGLDDAKHRFAPALGEDELASYITEYEKRIGQVETTVPFVLAGPRKPWYPGPNEETDVCWPLLEGFMKSSLGWDKDRRRVVDQSSSKVVAYTPDPVNRTWDSKGLVVGYVQSGKTTNYTAVIAKAADVGYKLIIVLSGIHNGLRRQTQERLDEQLTGLSETTWLPLTTTDRDFYKPTMGLAALMHGEEQKVALCVAKKNAAVLRRLDRWLETASKQRALTDVPTLVIDDEADQASVETKTVNPLIKSILSKLPRCTYVGYTATPFANVLIDPAGGELYPKSFILNLPRPDGYFGTERIFGRDQVEGDEATGADLDGYDMVRIVPDEEIDDLRPAGKQSAVDFAPSLTPSLTAAMRWFWLATAARRARGDHDHSTMLVHTAIKIDVHRAYRDPVEGALAAAALAVSEGDESFLNELRDQWDAECATVSSGDFDLHPVAFDTVLEYLPGVLTECRVVLDNCRSDDRLDYSAPGQVAIVVGGNTLSRGLTLEGLVVSFFVRAAQAYDTLLQMARWFGFRPGYEDLPRIWMTEQLRRWFRHLALVEHEIRLDIERYEQQNLTPLEFGVRIRTHPILRITAKMGAARPAYASYSGRRVQTRYFRTTDTDWLRSNVDAADALIAAARSADVDTLDRDNGALVYLGVPADLVLQFFSDYQPHSESPDLDPELVAKYVRRQLDQGQLEFWNVAVMAGVAGSEHGTVRLGGVEFRRIVRSKLAGTGVQQADIKTLMSKDHRTVDFMEPTEARKLPEVALMERRDQDPIQRNRGLLLIYPIDPVSAPDDEETKTRSPLNAGGDVIGMGLVFPGQAERATQVPATMVSVDLSDAEIEHEPAELASLEGDDDQDGGA